MLFGVFATPRKESVLSASDQVLLQQVPEKYRQQARMVLEELNRKYPHPEDKQLVMDIISMIIQLEPIDKSAKIKQIPKKNLEVIKQQLTTELKKQNLSEKQTQEITGLFNKFFDKGSIPDTTNMLPGETYFLPSMPSNLQLLSLIIEHPNYTSEVLETVKFLVEKSKTPGDLLSLLGNFRSHLNNLTYPSDINYYILKTIRTIVEYTGQDAFNSLSLFYGICNSNPKLINDKNFLDLIQLIAKKWQNFTSGVLSAIHSVDDHPSFSSQILTLYRPILEKPMPSVYVNSNSPRSEITDFFSHKFKSAIKILKETEKIDAEKVKLFAKKLGIDNINEEIIWNLGWAIENLGADKTRALHEFFGITYFASYNKKHLEELYKNLNYAIKKIGADKTRALHKEFGLTYFARYTKNTLEELHKNIDPKHNGNKPLLLVVYNKHDWNGAFYYAGKNLEKLLKFYKIIITETDNEDGFYRAIQKTATKEGKKIDVLVIGGHGEPNQINLGYDALGEKAYLDLTDEKQIKEQNLSSYMKKSSKIILEACSTGKDEKAIASMLSSLLGVDRVFAPRSPTKVENFSLNPNGEIDDVTYDVESAVFRGGRMGVVPKKRWWD